MNVELLSFIPNLTFIVFLITHSLTEGFKFRSKERLVVKRSLNKNEIRLDFYNEDSYLGVLTISIGKHPYPSYYTYNEPSILEVMMIPERLRAKTWLHLELSNDVSSIDRLLKEIKELTLDQVIESDSEPWEWVEFVDTVKRFFHNDFEGFYTEGTVNHINVVKGYLSGDLRDLVREVSWS